MAIYTSVKMTIKVAIDADLTKLLLHRDSVTITDQYTESASGTVNIAALGVFTIPMTHLTTGQFLYIEAANNVTVELSGGGSVSIVPSAAGTVCRFIGERLSFTSATITAGAVAADGVYYAVMGV